MASRLDAYRAEIIFDTYDSDLKMFKKVKRRGKKYQTSVDTQIDLFSIAILAEALNRTPQVVICWEKEGVFPTPMYVVSNEKKRWYSRAQILGIQQILYKQKITKGRFFDRGKFLGEVRERFTKFDLEVAE